MLSTEDKLTLIYIGGTLFVFLLLIFLMVYVYLHQMKVNRFKLQLNEQEIKKQEELFLALISGEEKERQRLAEELHDGIGAKLSGLKMSVEYLLENHCNDCFGGKENSAKEDTSSNQATQLLSKISEGMNESIVELREISRNLKPTFLATKGLSMVLTELVDHMNNQGACVFKLYIEPGEEKFARHIQVIYRITSELLNNILKHAKATQASAQVISSEGMIQIIAEDNGQGFDVEESTKGIGLSNIRSRLLTYKGHIKIESTRQGTLVIVELPLPPSGT